MSPVDNDKTSYFLTSLADSVPFPAPGFPNISIRRTLPSAWLFCASAVDALELLWRENGRAFWDDDDLPKPRECPGWRTWGVCLGRSKEEDAGQRMKADMYNNNERTERRKIKENRCQGPMVQLYVCPNRTGSSDYSPMGIIAPLRFRPGIRTSARAYQCQHRELVR
ncbi:hypothetical protein PHLCEN_2v8698 [Hermanssonia centrifuga]|uniref:Uncharacterized protein n=1 Tax=Hermanssonia centrifuga TaxID=98765 RepID=A0A2R6NSU1_9APHY|nr:hypothetical protein PHLCEN_2v8698 [Hermanssonia centrifuga]